MADETYQTYIDGIPAGRPFKAAGRHAALRSAAGAYSAERRGDGTAVNTHGERITVEPHGAYEQAEAALDYSPRPLDEILKALGA